MTGRRSTRTAAERGHVKRQGRQKLHAGPANRRGYTMVEVMMGLSILAIGSVSIIGLQKYAAMGTMTSRHITSASAISAGVLEAMNAESLSWVGNGAPAAVPDPALMPWLGSALLAADTLSEGLWTRPTIVAGTFNAFTIEGVPMDSGAPTAPTAYCSHVRAAWLGLQDQIILGDDLDAKAVRVEVRTFWAKSGRDISAECSNTTFTQPQIDMLLAGTTVNTPINGRDRLEYGVVYFTTIIRRPSP